MISVPNETTVEKVRSIWSRGWDNCRIFPLIRERFGLVFTAEPLLTNGTDYNSLLKIGKILISKSQRAPIDHHQETTGLGTTRQIAGLSSP